MKILTDIYISKFFVKVMSKVLMVLIGLVVVLVVVGFAMKDKPDLSPKTARTPSSIPKTTAPSGSLASAPSVSNTLTFSQLYAMTSNNALTPAQINFGNILTGSKR